jgi:membrane fusion protein (multidrug efflux system)
MRRAINTLIVLAGIALCVYVVILASAKNRQNSTNNNKSKPAAEAADPPKQVAPVKVAVVRAQPMMEYLLLPGTVEAWEDIDLSVKAAGVVEWIGPKEGDRVTSGETVLRLDTASKVALVNQAMAQLGQAEKQFDRVERLVADRVVTRAELDNATAARDVARANLEVAQVALNDATLVNMSIWGSWWPRLSRPTG